MKEQRKYEVIKELIDHGGNKNRAAIALGCSKRSIDRYIAGYKTEGKAYFIHGNQGRIPIHALSEETKTLVVDLYKTKYCDADIAHFTELIQIYEQIFLSESVVRNILKSAELISPRATREAKRAYKKALKDKAANAKTKKEKDKINKQIVELEDAHPRRPRCSNFGEMIQMDASLHLWFGDVKATLHIAIDDATGIIIGGWFDMQETLQGYYHVFKQILIEYGIPYMFYTDRRTVFEYQKTGSREVADDTKTQFAYACQQLGVEIKTTSVPQAKGRVERLFETVQSRLPVELRLEGVTTIEQANEYLLKYIKKHNAKFALDHNIIPSVFEMQPSLEKINMTLAIITQRTVDTGHSIRFENKYLRTINKQGEPIYFHKGTKGLLIRTFDKSLYFSVGDTICVLEEIPEHERVSRNFDYKPDPQKPKKVYIPPANHPWKLASFTSFTQKQAHRTTNYA